MDNLIVSRNAAPANRGEDGYLEQLAEEYSDVPDLYMTNGLWPSSLTTDEPDEPDEPE